MIGREISPGIWLAGIEPLFHFLGPNTVTYLIFWVLIPFHGNDCYQHSVFKRIRYAKII